MRNRDADQLEAALNGAHADSAGDTDGLVAVARALGRMPPERASPREGAAQAHLQTALRNERLRRARGARVPSIGFGRYAAAAAGVAFAAIIAGVIALSATGPGGVSEAVQGLFSDDANTKVVGIITDVADDHLLVQAGGETITVIIDDASVISDAQKEPIGVAQLAAGQGVEIKGDRQDDGSIVASRIKIEDNEQHPENEQ